MILEEETHKKFGYYPKDLKPKSNKRILVECDNCGILREIYKYQYYSLCHSCGLRTRKVSNETKQKIREANEGKHRSEKTKQKISNTLKGRHPSEETIQKLRGMHSGENCYLWKGGISYEPYCIKFNKDFKERVREYWNRKCALCDKTEKEQIDEMKREGKRVFQLSIHHVNYNKDTCCDNSVPLFVPLCMICHSKTNFNEEYWQKEFTRIIYNRNVNGKCFYTIEEMEIMNEINYIKK